MLRSVAVPCRRVFANQLAAWLLHGLLLDDASEFFVRMPTRDAGGAGSLHLATIDESLLPAFIPLRVAAKVRRATQSFLSYQQSQTWLLVSTGSVYWKRGRHFQQAEEQPHLVALYACPDTRLSWLYLTPSTSHT